MAVVIGCAGSFAQAADDDDDELLDTKIFRGILKGLGLRKDEPTGIDYRERSPLVLPHQQGIAAAGSRCRRQEGRRLAGRSRHQAGQDSARRRSANARASRRASTTSRCCRASWDNAPPAKAARPAKRRDNQRKPRPRPAPMPNWAPRASSTMFGSLWAPKEEYVPFTGEPARSQPDRAAARIPDALADPALRRRQRQVGRAGRSTRTSP